MLKHEKSIQNTECNDYLFHHTSLNQKTIFSATL